ncbi:DUF6779 domain-containing protein [Mycolicibacterium aichiense]|uniref:DUF6779 domain-containing protein n=1 Tax=Mycolicibacterium aichiense TaxID=1799 RepID=A0AAD1MAT2_9MYCO|nr:DUF6779 domain-containing protein [Mycolicibacterium aichiense]MCV7021098.1 hypothetical protein [Mycolicibacterium aichiense]BBX05674.1 hypothetical protein MAIC_04770 [Mycolicibacterium aichiense]STZ24983.1 conserved alanine, arginine and proline rich membrane protein [Mycolicibacterium aichiense]
MTVLSRGAKNRRGGRRPGWLLLTVLLVLAIAASSALVFTTRVELLKLAVILSLWAAVIGAFVSVMYRRQSDIDAARARDLKLVYDLQLDREISARREYELSVESHLRRELASELRAQAADEVAALRAELAALRANLEIMFDADLGDRPALEGERTADWTRDTTTMPPVPGRVESSRITPVRPEDTASRTAENPIIDVPEEPLVSSQPEQPEPAAPSPRRRRRAEPQAEPGGSHRRPWENGGQNAGRPAEPERPFAPPPPPPLSDPDVAAAAAALAPEPAQPEPPRPAPEGAEWRPVEADGRWLPPGSPGSNWVANADNGFVVPSAAAQGSPASEPRGRHWTPPQEPQPEARPEPVMQPAPEPAAPRSRHSVESPGQPAMTTPPPPARHRGTEEEPRRRARDAEQTGGQSVADLLARLQANATPGEGGRRRRRDE